jgi:DNA-binding NtrC family response regulator
MKNSSLRILVVDDEKDMRIILDKFLSRGGHMVRTVDNGAEAITATQDEDYDLVLCDLVMAEVFGYDVIKEMNKLEKRPKVGIITGLGEKLKTTDEEGYEVDFILKKPFKFSELTEQINNAMNEECTNG